MKKKRRRRRRRKKERKSLKQTKNQHKIRPSKELHEPYSNPG